MKSKRKREQRRKAKPKARVGFPYFQQIWWEALCDLRSELNTDCLTSKPDQLRFQTGRLCGNLFERMAAAKDDLVLTMFRCYLLVTLRSLRLGYDEPLRLHLEEMKAVGLSEQFQPQQKSVKAVVDELEFRLHSIASWMEAQESLGMWLAFNYARAAWRNHPGRTGAIQAALLARLPHNSTVTYFKGRQIRGARLPEDLGLGVDDKGVPWPPRQWANILEQASRFARKGHSNCTQWEQWVWWCYPVFRGYGWSVREVQDDGVSREFANEDSWTALA